MNKNLNAAQTKLMCDIMFGNKEDELVDFPKTCENCTHFFACLDDSTSYGWCEKADYWREGTMLRRCEDWEAA